MSERNQVRGEPESTRRNSSRFGSSPSTVKSATAYLLISTMEEQGLLSVAILVAIDLPELDPMTHPLLPLPTQLRGF